MSNGERSPAALIIGLILLAYAYIISQAYVDLPSWTHAGKAINTHVGVAWYAGLVVAIFGLWNLVQPLAGTKLDNVLRAPMAGIGYIMILAIVVRYYGEPLFKHWGGLAKPSLGWDFSSVLNFNYVLLGIIIGIILTNTIGIPKWAAAGVKTARLALKTGVITLGAMYSLTELAYLGQLSIVMIGIFVLGTTIMTLWLGGIFGTDRSLTGALSSGLGVCGVSAIVAAAPVVKAKSIDMAYSIGTVLLIGVVFLFIFPPVGQIFSMTPIQFGAWAGTGILNSAQVAAAALIYDPKGIDTLKVAEIFNITRVLFLPLIVIILAVWFAKGEEEAEAGGKVAIGKVLIDKFPVFVLGFILMFAFSSTGVFRPAGYELYRAKSYNFTAEKNKDPKKHMISAGDAEKLTAFLATGKVKDPAQKAALEKLAADKRIANVDTLAGVYNSRGALDKDTKKIVDHSMKISQHTPKVLKIIREYMIWFFAYGLIGLGMQITWSTMAQAGGKAALIGVIAGVTKAVLSLIVVLAFITMAV